MIYAIYFINMFIKIHKTFFYQSIIVLNKFKNLKVGI